MIPAQFALLNDRALGWRIGPHTNDLRGLRLLFDTPDRSIVLAIVRSAVRANHRLEPFDALVLTSQAIADARARGLDPGFFAAVLLQESGFDPQAFSGAGAVGIGQFTLDTAADLGIDPFDWRDAMAGSSTLIGRYVARYDGVYADPYATALAAYNAGPGTVTYYHGVPPYAETREYVADIYDRWARIERDATGLGRR